MRVTSVLGGIRSVFPLIKEHAPQCVTDLPSLTALPKATRLAFDATLMVQRLHFAEDRHPHRHVIGFHRLCNQMRELNLVPIMVFDNVGQGARLQAKAREQERRAKARGLIKLRARAEVLRAERLEALRDVLARWNALEPQDRRAIADLLADLNKSESQEPATEQLYDLLEDSSDDVDTSLLTFEDLDLSDFDIGGASIDITSSADLENVVDDSHIDESSDLWLDVIYAQEQSTTVAIEIQAPRPSQETSGPNDRISEQRRLATEIKDLMQQFRRYQRSSVSTSTAHIPKDSTSWAAESPTQSRLSQAESNVYARMSAGKEAGLESNVVTDTEEAKLHAQKAVEASDSLDAVPGEQAVAEEKVSKIPAGLAAPGRASVPATLPSSAIESAPDADLEEISERNAAIQKQYVKSGTPLSPSVFDECAEICKLHKIPVLWTGDGRELGKPHEGEAMASMLVRHGYADIVVSEDSDVILYDVPLLRGMMGQKQLQLVDSAAVRRTFFPPIVAPGSAEAAASEKGDEVDGDDLVAEAHAENQSRREMLEFALLCGTDFNRTMPGIASRRALNLIREFKSIEAVHAEAVRRQKAIDNAPKDAKKSKATGKLFYMAAKFEGQTPSSSRSLGKNLALRMPDGITWREYSKELTIARHVFTNPPTLYWQQSKVRHLKRPMPGKSTSQEADEHAAEATWPLLPPLTREDLTAVQAYLNKKLNSEAAAEFNRSQDGNGPFMRGHRTSSGIASSSPAQGFGTTPFGDGGPVASWTY